PAITPARLAHWTGLVLEGSYLRPSFGRQSDACPSLGEAEPAFALSAGLTYGYDDRQTVLAPDSGTAIRGLLEHNHVFGELAECEEGIVSAVSSDAIAASIRGVRQWKLGGLDQLSLRGKVGSYLMGTPREQLLFRLGGRTNVRGYATSAYLSRFQAIA